jgi:excisionase family DNA binding protein
VGTPNATVVAVAPRNDPTSRSTTSATAPIATASGMPRNDTDDRLPRPIADVTPIPDCRHGSPARPLTARISNRPTRRFRPRPQLPGAQPMTPPDPAKVLPARLLDIPAMAETLGVNTRHIRRLVAERRIPFIKWGHLIRFDPADVAEWLEASRRPPGRPA